MFNSNQHAVESEVPLAPKMFTEEEETKTTRKIQLGLKKQLYNNRDASSNKRISLRMMDDDENDDQQQLHISTKLSLEQRSTSEMNAVSMMMDRGIKKAFWMPQDPLRLIPLDVTTHTIEEEPEEEEQAEAEAEEEEFDFPFSQQDELPFQFKQKQPSTEDLLYVALDQENNDNAVFELPYVTAKVSALSPPPKEPSTTPASSPTLILPLDEYYINEEELVPFSAAPLSSVAPFSELLAQPYYSFIYEEDQYKYYTNTISSPRMSSTVPNSMLNYNEGKELTEETWEAIFHPLSTFKHNNQGQLEYYAWNPANLPQAAARVAQRVIHATAHAGEDDYLPASVTQEFFVDEREATLPAVQPTPPLKPSPVLTILESELDQQESRLTLVEAALPSAPSTNTTKQEYYDMLQKIRGEMEEEDSEFESIISSSGSEGDHDVPEVKDDQFEVTASKKIAMFISAILTRKPRPGINTTDKTHSIYAIQDTDADFHTAVMQDPETLQKEQVRYWTEKRLFFTGFVCPLIWYYVGLLRRGVRDPKDLRWAKRCKLAALYFTVVISVLSLVIAVKMAGSAASRQASSDTIRAVVNQ